MPTPTSIEEEIAMLNPSDPDYYQQVQSINDRHDWVCRLWLSAMIAGGISYGIINLFL